MTIRPIARSVVCCLLASLATTGRLLAQGPAGGCEGAQAQVRLLQANVGRDQRTIRSLGFEKTATDIEEWQKLTENAKAHLMSDAFDLLLASARKSISAAGSLSPPSASRAISRLRGAGINSGPLNQVIREIAGTPSKPIVTKDMIDFLDAVGKVKEGVSLAATANDQESRLEALSTVLGWFQTNPTLALLAADLTFTTSSIYNNAARRVGQDQIDQLTRLNERGLKSVKLLSEKLRTDVAKLNAAKQQSMKSCNTTADCLAEKQRCISACTNRVGLDEFASTYLCEAEKCQVPYLLCTGEQVPPSLLRYIARQKATDECKRAWDRCHKSCQPLFDQSLSAYGRCMDGCNEANDACLAAVPSL